MNSRDHVATAPFVPPRNQHSLLVIYATLDNIACVGMLALLIAGIRTQRLRSNRVLLNFMLVFFFSASGQTLLIWTGFPYDLHPPFGLCVTSSAWIAGIATMKAAAAFTLTCKVWAYSLSVAYPDSKLLRYASSSSLLITIPWLSGLPLFIAAFAMGASDHAIIRRSSVYYCLVDSRALSAINMCLAFLFEVFALVFAIWTATMVSKVRLRLRSMVEAPRYSIHYSLIIRTLIFSVSLAVAMGLELIIILTKVTAPIPGMVIACIDFIALVVFATDHVLLHSMFRCLRGKESRTSLSGGPTGSGPIVTIGSARDETRGALTDTHRTIGQSSTIIFAGVVGQEAYSLEDLEMSKTATVEAVTRVKVP